MYRERIRCNRNWLNEHARHDTAFVEIDSTKPGMLGLAVARILLFFSFKFRERQYQCALVNWLVRNSDAVDDDTGMWVVRPEHEANGRRTLEVIPLDSIAGAAHLLPVYGSSLLPEDFHFTHSLDAFRSYFVNCYADHHTHEFLK